MHKRVCASGLIGFVRELFWISISLFRYPPPTIPLPLPFIRMPSEGKRETEWQIDPQVQVGPKNFEYLVKSEKKSVRRIVCRKRYTL